nr:MAG TPA: hypothetical protein [Caudoviricetes sp.]
MMNESILITIKKMLGVSEDYDAFDTDIIININSALMVVAQLGIGPANGVLITGKDEKWESLVKQDDNLEAVKTYIYISTKLDFDPPSSGVLLENLEKQKQEYAWRLNVMAETPIK